MNYMVAHSISLSIFLGEHFYAALKLTLTHSVETPIARTPEEDVKRVTKLMKKGNDIAFNVLAGLYARGINGMPHKIWQGQMNYGLRRGSLDVPRRIIT